MSKALAVDEAMVASVVAIDELFCWAVLSQIMGRRARGALPERLLRRTRQNLYGGFIVNDLRQPGGEAVIRDLLGL